MGINQWQRANNVENVPMGRDVFMKMIREMMQYKDAIFSSIGNAIGEIEWSLYFDLIYL